MRFTDWLIPIPPWHGTPLWNKAIQVAVLTSWMWLIFVKHFPKDSPPEHIGAAAVGWLIMGACTAWMRKYRPE